MNHTSSSETLLMLLRAALGNEAVGALPSDINWQEVIDLSFDQGVAAIAVDGLGFAHDNDGSTSLTTSFDNQESLELALDSPELEDLKYEWLSPSGFSSFAPRQLSVLFNRLLSA